MHRFYTPIADGHARLRPNQLRQIRSVLRLHDGDHIAVFDGSGGEWQAQLSGAAAEIVAPITHSLEPITQLTLFQALIRPPRLELVLQKGTELGISRFVPFVAARSVATGERRTRWQAIVTEAAEQSGRRMVPEVGSVVGFDEALAEATREGVPFMPWEGASHPKLGSIHRAAPRLGLIIGPEGGFTEEEVMRARARGAITVSLGPRILRSETAAIAATAILLHLNGEM